MEHAHRDALAAHGVHHAQEVPRWCDSDQCALPLQGVALAEPLDGVRPARAVVQARVVVAVSERERAVLRSASSSSGVTTVQQDPQRVSEFPPRDVEAKNMLSGSAPCEASRFRAVVHVHVQVAVALGRALLGASANDVLHRQARPSACENKLYGNNTKSVSGRSSFHHQTSNQRQPEVDFSLWYSSPYSVSLKNCITTSTNTKQHNVSPQTTRDRRSHKGAGKSVVRIGRLCRSRDRTGPPAARPSASSIQQQQQQHTQHTTHGGQHTKPLVPSQVALRRFTCDTIAAIGATDQWVPKLLLRKQARTWSDKQEPSLLEGTKGRRRTSQPREEVRLTRSGFRLAVQ